MKNKNMITFDEIINYAQRAKLVYESDETIFKQKGIGPPYNSKYHSARVCAMADDVKFLVEKDPDKKIQWLAIRGTANFENVKIDAQYKKVLDPWTKIWFHEGFYKASMDIYALLKDYLEPGYELRITGHSLGGAIAAIIYCQVVQRGASSIFDQVSVFSNIKCVTFGQPKITNKKGVEAFRSYKLIRILDYEDPVPLLPPTTLFSWFDHGIYRHFGKEVLLKPGKQFEIIPEKKAEGIRLNSFWLHLDREKVKEHFMDNYTASLKPKKGLAFE